jgi:hypothetical protein
MAGMLFDMSTGTLAVVLGPEWQARPSQEVTLPDGRKQVVDERMNVVSALAKYLESKEVKDIPPGIMLTVVVLAYAAPRFQAPSTKAKIVGGWTWLKSKIGGFFKGKPKTFVL